MRLDGMSKDEKIMEWYRRKMERKFSIVDSLSFCPRCGSAHTVFDDTIESDEEKVMLCFTCMVRTRIKKF